ncbi:winged helix-turn-helix transcriptional regulator [Microcystis aeruginosa]|uniref:winged helix-turn-helix transcriptional regulator n=1 Tax=Microcystis aeruginosa TaxID=1126 RepID=UPI001D1579A8|nr:winged helix-turn-helix transcriptional regulator [Microcystis aeruginosa]MDB9435072.1 winged helix-turn-helix transcriptional regulator [Microcystis aeruginosa CS-552/01]
MSPSQLIHRKVYPEIPAKVAYSLTAFGEPLKPIILQMHQLGIVPTFRTSSYTFIYFYIPQDVLTKNLHCRNYY